MINWYVMHVQPNCELRVRQRLADRGIEFYLPTTPRKGFRGKVFEQPVFPGYVFARHDHLELYDLFRITRWLLRVLGDRAGPISVDAAELESLRLVLAQPKVVIHSVDRWHGGEEILVKSGPMAGAVGTVVYVKNQHRLVVSVPMLGRCVSTELDADAITELVKPQAA